MSGIKHASAQELEAQHKNEHEGYEYFRKKFVRFGEANDTLVSVYEIPPQKSAFPYHYHYKSEETFYIISGEGVLRTPEGERKVKAGDLLFFPTGEAGAHKLTNPSQNENLVYIDFDVVHDLDAVVYPDSEKLGIWGMGINKIFPKDSDVDYYHGE